MPLTYAFGGTAIMCGHGRHFKLGAFSASQFLSLGLFEFLNLFITCMLKLVTLVLKENLIHKSKRAFDHFKVMHMSHLHSGNDMAV